MRTKPHPEQGFRACLGIVRLARPRGGDALEVACLRASEIGGLSYSSVKSILQNNLQQAQRRKFQASPLDTATSKLHGA